MNRTDRLVAVLLALQARGAMRAEDLAAQFEVSLRTIYRDLEALSEGGVPLVATPGKGYRLMDGYFLPPLAFTATEAALLVLGGEFVKQRVDAELQSAAETALSKLSSVLPADRREAVDRWRSQMHFLRAPHEPDARMQHLRTAIAERQVVRLRYHAFRRAEAEDRDIEPLCLMYRSEYWQVGGYCRLRQGPRMFRLDRIDALEVLPERFTIEARHAIPWTTQPEPEVTAPEARVRFAAEIERWVRERQLFTLIGEEFDSRGPVFVYAIRDEQILVRWLLSWGTGAEVIAPASLRAHMAEEARAIARRHTDLPAAWDAPRAADIRLSTAPSHAGVEA